MKVTQEQAEQEINQWLDTKKVYDSVRVEQKANIDLLIEAITRGDLVYNESDNSLKHILIHPIVSEKSTTELTYKGRLNDLDMRPHLKGVASNDGDARVLATIAALTNTPKGILAHLDTIDRRISNSIALFFF